VPRDNFKN